ncbi:MAG TPA: MarR family transcriptional regulator [Defluviitaleaceae bacterium]|jgi:biotin operon repressor|nr:MarR family transcriptional regulator [Candidatus Epulonipiscium sp.]HOA81537.1 MarR family transcriptional regulator [Defluviitaleaceae bacterium]
MENYDVILDYFKKADKPVNAGLVASETGIERKEVDKVMKKLKEEGKIVSTKRCYWEISNS